MDWGKAFTFLYRYRRQIRDPLIACFISFVPVLGFAFWGYWLDVIRRVHDGQEPALPTWKGYYLMRLKEGLLYTLIALLYLLICLIPLPLAFLFGVLAIPSFESTMILILIVFTIETLAVSFLSPALTIRFALERRVRAAFQVRKLLAIARQRPRHYLLLVVVEAGLSLGLLGSFGLLGRILGPGGPMSMLPPEAQAAPYIGILSLVLFNVLGAALLTYVMAVWSHLDGQYAALADIGIDELATTEW